MQREDVERLEADLLRLAYECDEQGEGWQEDGPLLREAATALRALLAERDAAFAAGQESMRERAAVVCDTWSSTISPETDGSTGAGLCEADIRALPIKDKPDA